MSSSVDNLRISKPRKCEIHEPEPGFRNIPLIASGNLSPLLSSGIRLYRLRNPTIRRTQRIRWGAADHCASDGVRGRKSTQAAGCSNKYPVSNQVVINMQCHCASHDTVLLYHNCYGVLGALCVRAMHRKVGCVGGLPVWFLCSLDPRGLLRSGWLVFGICAC